MNIKKASFTLDFTQNNCSYSGALFCQKNTLLCTYIKKLTCVLSNMENDMWSHFHHSKHCNFPPPFTPSHPCPQLIPSPLPLSCPALSHPTHTNPLCPNQSSNFYPLKSIVVHTCCNTFQGVEITKEIQKYELLFSFMPFQIIFLLCFSLYPISVI